MTNFALLKKVTIDSTNDDLQVDASGTPYTLSLTHGDYYVTGSGESSDLLDMLETRLDSVIGPNCALTLVDGFVSIVATGSFYIYWADALTTFDSLDLGITSITTQYTTTATVADAGPDGCWYAQADPQFDGIAEPANPVSQNVTTTGAAYTHSLGSVRDFRRIVSGYNETSRVLNVDGDGSSYREFWEDHNTGEVFYYVADISGTVGPVGYLFDEDSCRGIQQEREGAGLEFYSVSFSMRKAV